MHTVIDRDALDRARMERGCEPGSIQRHCMTRRGFDPDVESHQFHGCFTLEAAKQSLFDSTRSNPISVPLVDDEAGIKMQVVIDTAKPLYLKEALGDDDVPDWYFEGWVMPTGPTAKLRAMRVRIYVATMGTGEFTDEDFFLWQEIGATPDLLAPWEAVLS